MTISRFSAFGLADQLRHGAHGAVDAPAAGLEQEHGDKPKNGGGQHDAVKSKRELGDAGVQERSVVDPMPRQTESPQQCHCLFKILGAAKYQVCIPQHLEKHDEKEDQKAIAEPLALHPAGNVLFSGQTEPSTQQAKQLSSAAVAVAVALCPFGDRNDQRDEKTQQPQPRKQNVEKAQDQIGQGQRPQVVVPMLFHTDTSQNPMTEAGHSLAHFPQPTHRSVLTLAAIPFQISMADRGHIFAQQPQATQVFSSTNAIRRFLVFVSMP